MAWWLRRDGEQNFELAQAAVRAAAPVKVGHALHESGHRFDQRGLRLRRSQNVACGCQTSAFVCRAKQPVVANAFEAVG